MTLVWLDPGLDGSGEEFEAAVGIAAAVVLDPDGSTPLVPAGEFGPEPGLGGVESTTIGAIAPLIAVESGLLGGAESEVVAVEEVGVEVSVSVTVGAVVVGAGVEVSVSVTVGAEDAVVVGAGVEVSVSVSVGAVVVAEVGVGVGGVVGVGVGVEVSVNVSVDVGVGVVVGGGVGVGIGKGVGIGVDVGVGVETTTTGAGAGRTSVVSEPETARSSRASSVSKSNRERDRCRRERFPGPRSSRSIHLRLGRFIPGCGERILTPWITLDVQSNGNSRATAPVGSFTVEWPATFRSRSLSKTGDNFRQKN